MYGVGGERSLVEEELHHLSGYDNARPVRIGNGAYNQMQHDIWGTMLDSVYLHAKSREQIPEALWPVLKNQVEEAIKHWKEPDRGIWEVRGEPQHFTSSKIMCWVALDRGSKLAELQGEKSYAQQWRADGRGDQGRHPGSRGRLPRRADPAVRRRRTGRVTAAGGVDSGSCPRMTRGYGPRCWRSPTNSPRTAWCCATGSRRLDDGLSGEEGTFTICSFWLVSALVEIGEVEPGQASAGAVAVVRQPAASVRRGDRATHGPPPGQLPAGVHPPGPDQRRGARHPGRGGVRQFRGRSSPPTRRCRPEAYVLQM